MSLYEPWLYAPNEDFALDHIDAFVRLRYVRALNDLGSFRIDIDAAHFDIRNARLDSRLIIWRTPQSGGRRLSFGGLVRRIVEYEKNDGKFIALLGPSYTEILRRRILAYTAGAWTTHQIGPADDVMKVFVIAALGAGASAGRTVIPWGFSVQGYRGLGTSVEYDEPWGNLLDVCQKIAESSKSTQATAVYFAVMPTGSGWPMEFQTGVGRFGADHRYPGGEDGGVLFALEFGNMDAPEYDEDRTGEYTYVYALGPGEGDARTIATATDATRVALSPLNRIEAFEDASQADTPNLVQDAADGLLAKGKAKITLSFEALQAMGCALGTHYGFGDYVTARYGTHQADLLVTGIDIDVDGNADKETIRLKLENLI